MLVSRLAPIDLLMCLWSLQRWQLVSRSLLMSRRTHYRFRSMDANSIPCLVFSLIFLTIPKDRVAVYIDVVRQASNISDLGAAFAFGLMNAIKKDKTFAMGLWTKEHVKQLLVPLDRHVKAARIGRTRREGALKAINRCWGPDVTGYFRSRNESEKTLRQSAHDNRQHHELSRGNQIAEENHRAARRNRRFATKGWY